ncbi:hypothetical protein [Kitasatospora sp. DSM 101779]|uniref:hypothetical protein n=1 Tax=Kitasatospora sp. DSM 101779 TaxID=2853165 RepID=UPI0021DA6964|nr:hypothetical protein [Kitasatospora sp. DSM 101779]MCU7827302.1 hypothetical protein [Kitasatospora sp. DSM 101779]
MTRPALAELLDATSPETRARERAERTLPVHPLLAPLLPDGGLPRGAAVEVTDTALLIQLAATAAARPGVFTAVVGLPDLGLAAALAAGIPHERLLLVDDPADHYAEVLATLAPVCPLILTRPPARLTDRQAARIEAHLRRHGTALLAHGTPWPGARLRLQVTASSWAGLGQGWGQLRARTALIHCTGRAADGRPRTARLLLPDEHGRLATPAMTTGAATVPPAVVATTG